MKVNGRVVVEPSDAELLELMAYAKETVGKRSIEAWLDGGQLPSSVTMGLLTGPNTWRREFDRKGVCLYRPTASEQAAQDAWSEYLAAHGGWPPDDETGAPPSPTTGAGTWVGISWTTARRHLREGLATTDQLSLFGQVAA